MTIYIMELLDNNDNTKKAYEIVDLSKFTSYELQKTTYEYYLPNDYLPFAHDFLTNDCTCLYNEREELIDKENKIIEQKTISEYNEDLKNWELYPEIMWNLLIYGN